jgi:hypothetical protein
MRSKRWLKLKAVDLEEEGVSGTVKIIVSNCENQGLKNRAWELLTHSSPSTAHCLRYYQAEPQQTEFAVYDCI